METTIETRYYLAATKIGDNGSTYNQEASDCYDGESVDDAETKRISPLQGLLDLMSDNRSAYDDGAEDRLRAVVASGECYDFEGLRYEWKERDHA